MINPGHCSKIVSNHIGYEIHDSAGRPILAVRTEFGVDGFPNGYVTTLRANFYDRKGQLVFAANSGEENERIETSGKSALGFAGGVFGFVLGMTEPELDLARAALATRGKVHQLLTGEISGQEVRLDGKFIQDAHVSNCKIRVASGNFRVGRNNRFENSEVFFEEEASNIKSLIVALMVGGRPGHVERDVPANEER